MGNRLRRRRLFDEDPHCYWCGVETVWSYDQKHGKKPPLNLATLDHLRSRLDPDRGKDYSVASVLACWECNWRRGKEEVQEKLSIHEQRWRARCWPLPAALREIFVAHNSVHAPQIGIRNNRFWAVKVTGRQFRWAPS